MATSTRKKRTMTLRSGINPKATGPGDKDARGYVVVQITDSLAHAPGDFLTVSQAREYCDASSWKVTIKS